MTLRVDHVYPYGNTRYLFDTLSGGVRNRLHGVVFKEIPVFYLI